ncbi:PucR family transcriptional regulator [Rhizohabitans arisaemae]|uniref:PucR family transcriptional regulator n=1 Tax=Rhizohabitans arisaemae TaxID=2720610 RepID=UPI0024B11C64|nr:helix-turn-helix domain-containing protein [Rhizohabitans arisaemae]
MIVQAAQELLEALALAIGRGVSIDNPEGRVIAHSAHHGDADPVRAEAVLSRTVPAEVSRWQDAHGIRRATRPVHVAANPRLRMSARLCVPLLHRGTRLGYLWLIEGDRHLTVPERERAVADSQAIAALLGEGPGSRSGSSGLLRTLLTAKAPGPRAEAEAALIARGAVERDGAIRIAVVEGTAGDPARGLGDRVPGVVARAGVERHLALLLSPDARLATLAERFVPGPGVRVGVSALHPRLADARQAHRQALAAARAVRAEPGLGPVLAWERLGVYRLLAEYGHGVVTGDPLDRLRERDARGTLLATLERYLDTGCDAQETARTMHLHRTSLYYRLGRIEEITGRSLRDGRDRLELHLALKLARWTGV